MKKMHMSGQKEHFFGAKQVSRNFWTLLFISLICLLQWNTSHAITHIGFGDDYPGLVNPLDSTVQTADKGNVLIKHMPYMISK